MPGKATITGCPCNAQHELSGEVAASLEQAIREHGPDTPYERIGAAGQVVMVPRIYTACHSLDAGSVPALARQYGWPVEDESASWPKP